LFTADEKCSSLEMEPEASIPFQPGTSCVALRTAETFASCMAGAEWCSPLRLVHHHAVCGTASSLPDR